MKNFKKCTIEELLKYCDKNYCGFCPLKKHDICSDDFQIWKLKTKEDIEIKID